MDLASQQRRGDGDAAERLAAARFAALLRDERDPAAIWSIDVSSLLEAYLNTLPASTGTQSSARGPASAKVNFAEAALLIQGSASIYGRKADFLYSLVLQALSLFSPGDVGGDGRGAHDDEANVDSGNEELPFLNLDDLPVLDEADEDEDEDQAKDSDGATAHSSRPPFIFLGLDEENIQDVGVSGDGAGIRTCRQEAQRGVQGLSRYACASSKLDASGAVRLSTLAEDCLPEDAEDGDPQAAPAGCFHGDKRGDLKKGTGGEDDQEPSEVFHQTQPAYGAADDEGWDGGGLDEDWSARPPGQHSPSAANGPQPWGMNGEGEGGKAWGRNTGEEGMGFEDDPDDGEVYDPYKLLDMEDVTGGLPESAESIWNRPLVVGRPKLRLPQTGTISWHDSPTLDPLLSASAPWLETSGIRAAQGTQGSREQLVGMAFAGPMDAILSFMLGGEERRSGSGAAGSGRDGGQTGQGKKARGRAEFEGPQSRKAAGAGSVPGEFGQGEGGGDEEGQGVVFGNNDEPAWNMDGDDGFGGDDDDIPSRFGKDDNFPGVGAGLEGDDAFGAGTTDGAGVDFMNEAFTEAEALLRKARERDERQRTGLEKRVAQWQGALLPVLQKEEERGPFDIHQYAEQVLRTLEERAPQPDAPMPFRELVKGGDRPQVARSFAAMLHLVNQGNISFKLEGGADAESMEGLTQEGPPAGSHPTKSASASAVMVAPPNALSVSLLSSQRQKQDLVLNQLLD